MKIDRSSDDDPIHRITADVVAFGLPADAYSNALRRLLNLDSALKEELAAEYLDAILEILSRLQDTFVVPFLDPSTSALVRDDATRLLQARQGDAGVRNVVDDVLSNLPSPSSDSA